MAPRQHCPASRAEVLDGKQVAHSAFADTCRRFSILKPKDKPVADPAEDSEGGGSSGGGKRRWSITGGARGRSAAAVEAVGAGEIDVFEQCAALLEDRGDDDDSVDDFPVAPVASAASAPTAGMGRRGSTVAAAVASGAQARAIARRAPASGGASLPRATAVVVVPGPRRGSLGKQGWRSSTDASGGRISPRAEAAAVGGEAGGGVRHSALIEAATRLHAADGFSTSLEGMDLSEAEKALVQEANKPAGADGGGR